MSYLSKLFLSVGFFSILGQSLFQESYAFSIKNNLLIAQSETCPIDEGDYDDSKDKKEIQESFAEDKCEKTTLQEPTIYYRYYSSDGTQRGRFMTNTLYQDRNQVIEDLALNQDWGNFVTMVGAVILPKGTVVYKGKVASQENKAKDCKYKGGGNQFFVPRRFLSDKENTGERKDFTQMSWFSAPKDMLSPKPYVCKQIQERMRAQ
ncbi:hypothetical protein [Cylindrospermum sp. FACHB-282]|uniref:hypothetical protein n=1 Tax=Cylindrospermum sp. FACHB-282 TaxID=2692794 RepID=UPI001685E892|nr:hypothetical protein [Cylindrospermum sp. FACHB-282]MBD2388766.1 hypothetical protein [Cylindrospermum sp. FACHB-282]